MHFTWFDLIRFDSCGALTHGGGRGVLVRIVGMHRGAFPLNLQFKSVRGERVAKCVLLFNVFLFAVVAWHGMAPYALLLNLDP